MTDEQKMDVIVLLGVKNENIDRIKSFLQMSDEKKMTLRALAPKR